MLKSLCLFIWFHERSRNRLFHERKWIENRWFLLHVVEIMFQLWNWQQLFLNDRVLLEKQICLPAERQWVGLNRGCFLHRNWLKLRFRCAGLIWLGFIVEFIAAAAAAPWILENGSWCQYWRVSISDVHRLENLYLNWIGFWLLYKPNRFLFHILYFPYDSNCHFFFFLLAVFSKLLSSVLHPVLTICIPLKQIG